MAHILLLLVVELAMIGGSYSLSCYNDLEGAMGDPPKPLPCPDDIPDPVCGKATSVFGNMHGCISRAILAKHGVGVGPDQCKEMGLKEAMALAKEAGLMGRSNNKKEMKKGLVCACDAGDNCNSETFVSTNPANPGNTGGTGTGTNTGGGTGPGTNTGGGTGTGTNTGGGTGTGSGTNTGGGTGTGSGTNKKGGSGGGGSSNSNSSSGNEDVGKKSAASRGLLSVVGVVFVAIIAGSCHINLPLGF